MTNFRKIIDEFSVPIPVDQRGYLGRECPNSECKGYFKIVPGTGLSGVSACHCPYCGYTAEQSGFNTQDQIAHAQSVVLRNIIDKMENDEKKLEFNAPPREPFGYGLSMTLRPGWRPPVHTYQERALETHIQCTNCTLQYAVYGVFAYCPDCAQHNSLQILGGNLDLVCKMLDMALTAENEIADRLIGNGLEDSVSAFDGYGRELCRIHAGKSIDPDRANKLSFQNLVGVNKNLADIYLIDLAAGVSDEEWKLIVRGTQKRHVLEHKAGVVDKEYKHKSGDSQAIVGHKILITADEVREFVRVIRKLAHHLYHTLQ